MADALKDLDESKWDAAKKKAKIPATPIFKALFNGTASVGSAIKAYQVARGEWKAFKSGNSVKDYSNALSKLEAAFIKFSQIKEFKDPAAKELKTAIDGWLLEVRAKKAKVDKFYQDNTDALKANDIASLKNKLAGAGIGI